MVEKKQNTFDWKVIRRGPKLSLPNADVYVSERVNSSDSRQIVIVKQNIHDDGSPNGNQKQLWLPKDNSLEVLNATIDFINSE